MPVLVRAGIQGAMVDAKAGSGTSGRRTLKGARAKGPPRNIPPRNAYPGEFFRKPVDFSDIDEEARLKKTKSMREMRSEKRRKSISRLDLVEESKEATGIVEVEQPDPVFTEELEALDTVNELYVESAEGIKWNHGMREVRRLCCALKFLVEDKRIENEIFRSVGDEGDFEGDLLTSTIASGSKTVDEFKDDRIKVMQRNKSRRQIDQMQIQREEEEKEIERVQQEEKEKAMRDKNVDPADQTMFTHYKAKRRNPKFPLVSDQQISSSDDFKAFIKLEVRTKELRAYERQWAIWEEKHATEKGLRKKLDYILNPNAFDPDPIVTEFEARSYKELMHFLFTRAKQCDDGTDAYEKSKMTEKELIFYEKLTDYFVTKLQKFVKRLRNAESNPHPLRDFGHEFVYKIDNWLAILLFRRARVGNKDVGISHYAQIQRDEALQKYMEEQAEIEAQKAENSRLVYWQALVHAHVGDDAPTSMLQFSKVGVPQDQANRSYLRPEQELSMFSKKQTASSSLKHIIEFFFYGFLLTAVVCISVWGLYEIWKFTSTRSLAGVSDKLSSQIEQAVEKRFFSKMEDVVRASRYTGTGLFDINADSFDVGDKLSLERELNLLNYKEVEYVDRFLVETIQRMNVTSVYVQFEEGQYISAFTGDRSTYVEPGGELLTGTVIRTVEYLGLTANELCMLEYKIDSETMARDWTDYTILGCREVEGHGERSGVFNFCDGCQSSRCELSDSRAYCQEPDGTPESAMCMCQQGFQRVTSLGEPCTEANGCMYDEGAHCVDIDECQVFPDLCGNGNCTNIEGSYKCECDKGKTSLNGDGTNCKRVDDCVTDVIKDPAGTCYIETAGSRLMCMDGYILNSTSLRSCIQVNECDLNEDLCGLNSVCTDKDPLNDDGLKYECSCNSTENVTYVSIDNGANCYVAPDETCKNPMPDTRLSSWYVEAAQWLAQTVDPESFNGYTGPEAAHMARSLGEYWSDVHRIDAFSDSEDATITVGRDIATRRRGYGVSFTFPIFESNTTQNPDKTPVFTPDSTVDIGHTVLKLQGVIGADMSVPLMEKTLRNMRVGRTGTTYIASAVEGSDGSKSFQVLATGESSAKDNSYIRHSTSRYLRAKFVNNGMETFSDIREPFNCTAFDEDSGNSQELFSEAELQEVKRVPITEISGVKTIFSARLIDLLYVEDVPARNRVPSSWVLVDAFPAQDYFAAVTESEKKTLALGSVALFLGFVLLYFTYGLIPNMKKIRRNVMMDVAKQNKLEVDDYSSSFSLKDAVQMTRLRRKKRKERAKKSESRQQLTDGDGDMEMEDGDLGRSFNTSRQSDTSFARVNTLDSNMSTLTDVNEVDVKEKESKKIQDLKDEFGEKWENHTYKYAVVFTAVLIVLLFASIAFVWSSSSSDAVELIGDDLVTETRDHIEYSTNRFLDIPVLVNHLNAEAYGRFQDSQAVGDFEVLLRTQLAQFPGNGEGYPPIVHLPPTLLPGETDKYIYDRYFTSMLSTFRNDDGTYPLNFIYAAFPNGHFAGARVNPDDRSQIQIAALDDYTNGAYVIYGMTASGVRNTSDVVSESEVGAFDPRTRVWYTTALEDVVESESARPTWTSVYLFSGTETVGLTSMIPILNEGQDNVHAIFGVDINMKFLSEFLNDAQVYSSCASRFFVMQRTGELTASSTLEVTRSFSNAVDDAGVKVVFLLNATQASDEDLSSTASFLTKRKGGLARITDDQIVERPLQSPITGVSPIVRIDQDSGKLEKGMDWIIVTTLPFDVFLGQFENYSTLSFLLGVATIGIIAFLVTLSFREFESKILDQQRAVKKVDKEDVEKHEMAPGETEEEWEERSLVDLMREIRPTIIQACAYEWNRHHAQQAEDWEPISIEMVREYAARTGIKHIRSGQKGRDVLKLASLEERKSSVPRRSYKLYTNAAYQKFLMAVIVMHISLALFEPDTAPQLKEEGVSGLLSFMELCALGLETFDIILWFVIKVRWRDKRREKEEIKKMRERRHNKGKHKDSMKIKIREKYGVHLDVHTWLDILYSFLLFLVWVDWYLKWSSSVSFQYFIPIRPFLIILRSPNLRRTTGNFLQTVYTAKDIFALFFVVIIVAAALGVVMFRRTLTNTAGDGLEASYTNYVRAITTTFVYVSTGDNYTDLVYDAYEISPFFMIYFLTFTVFGMFFILAMVIGWFQVAFVKMARQRELRQKLLDRTGMVSCFILLDTDGSEKLNWTELENFMVAVRPLLGHDDEQLAKVYKRLKQAHTENNKLTPEEREERLLEESQMVKTTGTFRLSDFQKSKNEEIGLSVGQFVNIVESIKWDQKTYAKDVTKINKFRQTLQIRVFEQRWYSTLLIIITFTQILLITLFGTIDSGDEYYVEWSLVALYIVHTCDILLRRYTYGKKEYWNYGSYHRHAANRYQQWSNRYDMILLIIWLVGFGSAYSAAEGKITFNGDNKTRLTIVFSLPILRTFSLVKRIRNLFFTLIQILPKFADLFTLLVIIFIVYGVVGVGLFSEKFEDLLQDDAPPANFNSLSEALQTLFQMLVGEAWADIMYAGIRVTRTFTSAWYFISFICFATLLFVNIFIGLVLQAFSIYVAESEEEEKEAEKERRELEERITGIRQAPKLSRVQSRHVISDDVDLDY